jgi:hypothetical protein
MFSSELFVVHTFDAGITKGPYRALFRFAEDRMRGLSETTLDGFKSGATCSSVFGGAAGTAIAEPAKKREMIISDLILNRRPVQ